MCCCSPVAVHAQSLLPLFGCHCCPLSPLLACRCCSSVPSGRVGNSKDAIFRSNEHFRGAVAEREAAVRGCRFCLCVTVGGGVISMLRWHALNVLLESGWPPSE